MRRTLIIGATTVIILLGVATFFSIAYLTPIPLGGPSLNVKLTPNPPWNVQTGRTIKFNVSVANNAWFFAAAKNVHLSISGPKNFTICGQGTNECNLTFDTLRGGETRDNTLNLTAPYTVSKQNYNLTIMVTADNAEEQSLAVQINVNQTTYIP